MPKQVKNLNDTQIKAAQAHSTKVVKLFDGQGLQLWILPNGGKYWRADYRIGGKRKNYSIGTYPQISLKQARELSKAARELAQAGTDPLDHKRTKKAQAMLNSENTFASVAAKLVSRKQASGKRAPVTIAKMEWILRKVNASLGNRPVSTIKTHEIMKCLENEREAGNFETARRMRTVLGEVFRFAIQNQICELDPVAAIKGDSDNAPKVKHFAAITDPRNFGELLRKIDAYCDRNFLTGSALKLMAILYPRPGELRQAEWREFDLAKGIWTIPAVRMKMRKEHSKPLPWQAIKILNELYEITGPHGLVFPSVGRAAVPMSENTMNVALRRMGVPADQQTSHGFRASASTMLNESNQFSIDAVEYSLAHIEKDAIRKAYARGDAMSERIKMAQWWADKLDELRTVN
ncbi:MAG: integrase arm-type DNA-binding domain-containing protein [Aestuariivirga sp.]